MRSLVLVKTVVGATWAKEQARQLSKLGVDIHVVAPSGDGLMGRYREFGAHTHILQTDIAPLTRSSRFFKARADFRSLVAEVKPDVIHSHFVGNTLFMRLALGKRHPTPRLFQVPGPLHLENLLTRRGEIATAGPVDHWAASCMATRSLYQRAGVPGSKVGLSYYGVEFDRLDGAPELDLRGALNLSRQSKLIGMVAFAYPPKTWLGQRVGLKGHEDLIDAVALLVAKGLDVHCVFVGDAWGDRRSARAYFQGIKSYGRSKLAERVHFLGRRTDVSALYPNFDVAVHPSHSENLGGAAESLFLAVPTVATRVGGFPDIVIDGQTGWLASPREPARLSEAIEAALADPVEARRRATAGRALTRVMLDIETTAASMLDIYRRMTLRQPLMVPL